MNRLEFVKTPNGRWVWLAKDVRGVVCGRSQQAFSSRASCVHNASITQAGLAQGLKAEGYTR